jgi:HPt (histidine-containing phosphotransfer) domain-containing protein
MIDRSKLQSLLSNDQNMVQRFLNIFKSETPSQLKILKSAVLEKNWELVSITAHGIKNQCLYLGLDEIAQLAYKIEQLSEQNNELGLTPGLVEKLNDQLSTVIRIELS